MDPVSGSDIFVIDLQDPLKIKSQKEVTRFLLLFWLDDRRIRIHTSDYWIRIREAQKLTDPDPQHCPPVYVRAKTAGARCRSCRACCCSVTAVSPPQAFSWRPPGRPSSRRSIVRTGRLFVPVRSLRVCFRQSWALLPRIRYLLSRVLCCGTGTVGTVTFSLAEPEL
jgi:hypothetical protein